MRAGDLLIESTQIPLIPGTKKPAISDWKHVNPQYKVEGERGIITGPISGIFVVDLDVKNGKDGISEWVKLGGSPSTLTSKTPSGGVHLYFKMPGFQIKDYLGRLAPGIDIKGEGHVVDYEVILETEPIEAPDWLLEWLHTQLEIPVTPKGEWKVRDFSDPEFNGAYQRGLRWCQKDAPAAVKGTNREGVCLAACGKLKGLGLPADVCLELLERFYNPRCLNDEGQPWPWSRQELEHKLKDARVMEVAPPGFLEKLLEPKSVDRRIHNPNHEYSCQVGEVSIGGGKKASIGEIAADLIQLPDWEGVLQYDEFRHVIRAVDPPIQLDAESKASGLSDVDLSRIRCWFELKQGRSITKEGIDDAVSLAAAQCSYHPVREYLRVISPATGLLDSLAADALGDYTPFAQKALKKTLVGAVRRVMKPGLKMDYTLVLYGKQGVKKSSFVAELFGEFVRSDISDIRKKDAQQDLLGSWGVELAELEGIIRQDPETVKSFLSRNVDDFRLPYARKNQSFPRQCVFIGTTNADKFLRDETGNRRFWIINADKIDLEYVRKNRDRIWAEAYVLAQTDYPHWCEDEEEADEARASFLQLEPWHDLIKDWLEKNKKERVRVEEVLRGILPGATAKDLDGKAVGQVIRTLKRLGWKNMRTKNERYWSHV